MATLVIIDDEQEICEILEDVFAEEKGYAILTADNGPEGLELIKKHRPDVIILDIKLTVQMDGVEVLRQIRRILPRVKVVVITGFVDEEMEREIREIGIDGYIEKPFTPPRIIRAVQDVLETKRREEGS